MKIRSVTSSLSYSKLLMTVVSCNDFLDRNLLHLSHLKMFQTVDHFASYAISHYQGLFPFPHGGVRNGDCSGDSNAAMP